MDDDYVAQVLAKEAQDSSQKYSTEGLGAYRAPRKPAANAPKPNTRFLRHLIKETDNHNVALKRKEEKEARDRMRQLRDQSTTGSTSTSHTSRRHDRRDIARGSDRHSGEHREDRHRSHRRRHRSRSTSADRDRSRRHRRRDEDYDRSRDGHRERTEHRRERHRHESSRTERRDRERSYSRSRSRSPRRDRTSQRHRSERRHHRSKSPSGARSSQSHRERRPKHDEEVPSRAHLSPKTTKHREAKSPSPAAPLPHHSDGESDPLEDLVGPLPPQKNGEPSAPIRSRGRGAYKPNSSTIDSHFAPDYDPTLDVQPDDDGTPGKRETARRPVAGLMGDDDDWDMALEALRDRTRWRQKGEERLRAAGLGENAIDRWKGNSAFAGVDGEGKPEDVRWSKKGEGREWDRGKFVNNDGHIDVRAAWQS